jgi:hypothetical protein
LNFKSSFEFLSNILAVVFIGGAVAVVVGFVLLLVVAVQGFVSYFRD